jgi:putative endonuclease
MNNLTQTLGKKGEDYACMYYVKYGFGIVARNYRCAYGEIDVIAQKDDKIFFCEVKTRNASSQMRPSVNVTLAKQKKLIKTAAVYMQQYKTQLQPVFDVIEVNVNPYTLKCTSLNRIENAFIQGGNYAVF